MIEIPYADDQPDRVVLGPVQITCVVDAEFLRNWLRDPGLYLIV